MKRLSIVFLIVVFVFMLCSCVDYSAIEKEEAKQVMALQKEEQEEKETLDKISRLEQENEAYLQTIEDITKQNESLESDYDEINKKYKEYKMDAEKYKGELNDAAELFYNSRKVNDFLKDIIIADNVMNNKLTFEFVDVLSVEYSPMLGTSVTFDRVKTEYLRKGFNPLSTFVIDDEAYYDDESYNHAVLKKETMEVPGNAYVKINGIESFGFDEKSAVYLKQILEVPEDEVEFYDWYIEDKQPDTDSDGNEVEEKRIYFVGIIGDEIVIMMERGIK